jgi:asparagine synthase (glutamine-hydrolysing)
MSNEDGTLRLVYNGEIYNFQELRADLVAKGHLFRSQSDTEVILHLYEEYGIEGALTRMNGMFAFALWDAREQTLTLARDRVGKKPLYYALLQDGVHLAFASEIKALFASKRIPCDIDPVALDQVWTVTTTVGMRTAFKYIKRLPPAHYAVWSAGRLKLHEYWDCRIGEHVEHGRSLDCWADELEQVLRDAVQLRLIADVPVGLFLSGGIDSSLIAALTASITKDTVTSYTVGFSENAHNEAPYAARVAEHLGIENRILTAPETAWMFFEDTTLQFDEPFGDMSVVPTRMVAGMASVYVKTALTGDGGDELFAGYNSYRQALQIWGSRRQRKQCRTPLTLGEWLWVENLRWKGFPGALMSFEGKTSRCLKRALYKKGMPELSLNRLDLCERSKWLNRTGAMDLLSTMQYLAFHTWLPDAFLRKVDMMSMAHGLECRSPLLDYRVIELAARLPLEMKIGRDGRGKRILRHLLRRFVPDVLFDRPKRGFDIPWALWCKRGMADHLRTCWTRWENPWFKPSAAERLFPRDRSGHDQLQWTAFSMLKVLGDGAPAGSGC